MFVMNALTANPGAVGYYATPQAPNTNFNPLLKGVDVMGAVNRGIANGNTGYSAFLFALLQGTAIGDVGYLLGLSDGDPSHIELRKGIMSIGLPDEAPGGSNKVLRRSTAIVAPGDYAHLRLEVVCNDSGDTILNCYQNDLSLNDVDAPDWQAIAGMDPYVDDVAGINTGTIPLVGGRAGYGGTFSGVTRRAYFDYIRVAKQL